MPPFGESTMLQFLELPVIIWSIIMFFFLFFFVLFFRMLPRTNGKHQTYTDTSTKVAVSAKENRSECTMLGLLEKLPKGEPIPNECMSCQKLAECTMAKKAFDWYLGREASAQSMSSTSDIRYMDYGMWKMEVLKISRHRLSVEVETVQTLIERGNQFKRQGKIRNYDEWAHFMWVLKNRYEEMTSETH